MDIQTSKLELVKLILDIEDEKVIDTIISTLKSNKKDFYLNLTDNEKEEIQLGIKQLDSGHRISLDAFIKRVS